MAFERINEYAAEKQKLCTEHDTISDALFKEYGVNRGLRDINGKGVLTGLTRISKIVSGQGQQRALPSHATASCGIADTISTRSSPDSTAVSASKRPRIC